jgi:hypothetical protein
VAGAQAAFDVAGVDTAGLEEGGGEGEGPRGGKGKGKAKRSRGIRSKAKASARGGVGGGAALSAEGASENSAAEAARIAGMECGVVQGGLCVCYRTWLVVQRVAVVLWGSLGLGVWHVSVPSCCINTLLCAPSFAVDNDLSWLALSLFFVLILLAQICSRPACGCPCVARARSPAGGRAVHGCAPLEGTPASHGGPCEGSPGPHQGSRAESRHGRKLALSLLRCGELGTCADV